MTKMTKSLSSEAHKESCMDKQSYRAAIQWL